MITYGHLVKLKLVISRFFFLKTIDKVDDVSLSTYMKYPIYKKQAWVQGTSAKNYQIPLCP